MAEPRDPQLPVDPDLAPDDPAEPLRPGPPRDARSRRTSPSVLAAVALGGALGAPARYGVAQIIHVANNGFPWATFWTNISGSLALGFILVLILEHFPPTRYLRPFVATGFLGAYTTYSTFAVETDLLIKNGHAPLGIAYAGASLMAGLLAVWAGIWSGRVFRVPRRGGRR
jgi:CrcB protein